MAIERFEKLIEVCIIFTTGAFLPLFLKVMDLYAEFEQRQHAPKFNMVG